MKNIKELHHIESANNYSELDYLLYKIFFHGAPTISRLKPSSLICFKNSKSAQLKDLWDRYKDEISALIPLKYYELKRCNIGVSILFYREDWLGRLLNRKENKKFLDSLGYECYDTVDAALDVLKEHYKEGCPDEIGVFLGYPLSDVIAFTSEHKQNSIGVGYWRVYSNLSRAKKIFCRYDEARQKILGILDSGVTPCQQSFLDHRKQLCLYSPLLINLQKT